MKTSLSSPLINGLPKFTFDSSFKNGMLLEEIRYSNLPDKTELIMAILDCDNWDEITNFMSCGNLYSYKENNQAVNDSRLYSFIYDWGAIYTAFLQQYNIDLLEVDMHYWKFVNLFRGLKNTIFNDIIEIRMTDLSKIKDPEYKSYIQDMQEYYRLPNENYGENQELIDEFERQFG